MSEVEFNRRLSRDVYLGGADVVMDGEPVDHMVIMRALPEERRPAILARAGDQLDQWLDKIGVAMGSFCAGASRSAAMSQPATAKS